MSPNLRKSFDKPIVRLSEAIALAAENNIPKFRVPSGKDVQNVFPALRRREHIGKSSFEGLAAIAAKNPDKVYLSVSILSYSWLCTSLIRL